MAPVDQRFAEAMTFAVACAGLFPLLHLGRPWYAYWLFPYPNTMGIQPQFRSPLVWDVFAVSTYFTVSLLFWYVGLIPDLATMRDQARQRFARFAYGILAMGWRGSAIHWHRYEMAYLLLAGLATPLVVSVHTVVSLIRRGSRPGLALDDFSALLRRGRFTPASPWCSPRHPLRKMYGLKIHHLAHLKNMARSCWHGLIVAYGYSDGDFHGLVQRQYLRAVPDVESNVRSLLVHVWA
jgi:molybdopterin-containing oxidoreductase family membrane subunit